MAKCPACRSTRVYKGYRPAPLLLRLVFIHDFLCENCNLQFRGFSIRPPRSRRRKGSKKSSESGARTSAALENSSAPLQDPLPPPTLPNPLLAQAKSAAASSLGTTVPNKSVSPQPARPAATKKEPSAPPTIQGQWKLPAEALEELETQRRSRRSRHVCPNCGATDTERRRRKLWEKAAFYFTSIRAYQCRICGADFYARREKKSEE